MRSALFAITLLLSLPLAAAAQSALESTDPFVVSTNPEHPVPYGQVTLSFSSSTLDLSNSTLSITQDGATLYSGNVKPVAVTLGKAGSISTVRARLTSNGNSYTKTLSLQPQDVALIAEPVSSVPTLYPGKSLVPLEGSTRVVAVANFRDAAGKAIDPADLSYAWTVENTRMSAASGIGKNTIMVASPLQYRTRTVSVVVRTQSGSLAGGATIALTPAAPTVRVYEYDPLLGIRFDRALSGIYAVADKEVTFFAAPFSMPLTDGAPVLSWFLNGSAAQTGSSITLRPTGEGKGSATLSLTASSGATTGATLSLPLSFGAPASTNFFGL